MAVSDQDGRKGVKKDLQPGGKKESRKTVTDEGSKGRRGTTARQ